MGLIIRWYDLEKWSRFTGMQLMHRKHLHRHFMGILVYCILKAAFPIEKYNFWYGKYIRNKYMKLHHDFEH